MDESRQLTFRKSSRSGDGGCVEVAMQSGQIYVRDSKNPGGAVLQFDKREWDAFVGGVLDGEFTLE